ncbi:family 16 glycosylhydrolase [Kocuria sp. TGY1127_2]|uniref:family 16 glycosylhydrolase n=1 Tax=Kocuria sp. TGY1127_2 TaxID=2711328 RepID=UPI0015BC8A3A|nr:family 16 glycosylhydrolase [Kocuria sp. TGY1127_2]
MNFSPLSRRITRISVATVLAITLSCGPAPAVTAPARAVESGTAAATEVTPKGPTFNEIARTVYIPSDAGVRYYIDVAGKNITKEGLPYAKPGTYTEDEGIAPGAPITVTAKSAGSATVLTGTTRWETTYRDRPSYSLEAGDEFNDPSALPSSQWSVYTTRAANLGNNGNTVYTPENVSVKDGNLEIRTERHCLAGSQEPSAQTVSPGGAVCPSGTRTVYTSGRINTDFIYNAPFEMDVRARMSDDVVDGLHFAAWIRNNQPYCTQAGIEKSAISELDTMEVFSQHSYTTNTSHISCTKQDDGGSGTKRDAHKLDTQIAGAWHNFKMTWDGYAIRYYLDGQLVPSSWGQTPETTSSTVGMSDEEFRATLNENPYQAIIDSLAFPTDTGWINPPRADRPFPARVDKVDYIRMSPREDVFPTGAIKSKWKESAWLGEPVTGERDAEVPGSRVQTFENGLVYWSESTGAHSVRGGIKGSYEAHGAAGGLLGLPTSDERQLKGGASQSFQGGQVHWSPSTGGHASGGAIQAHWAGQGWENGWLGYPTSDEFTGLAGGGASQTFQNGTLFWDARTGTVHPVNGAILGRYGQYQWESGKLGYPRTGEQKLRNGASQVFDGGQIHWSPSTGAHATGGAIKSYWADSGWENGWLGYPTGEESPTGDGGVRQTFQHGTVTWHRDRPITAERR